MLNNTDKISRSMMIDISSDLKNHVINRIHHFHILCIYDSREKQNRLKCSAKGIVLGKKCSIPLFSNEQEGETFIISEASYKQNEELFRKLRMTARDDVFTRVATGIAGYFLSEYAGMIQSSMSHHPKLKNLQLLDTSVQKIKSLVKKNTFLAEETAWDTFYNWFRSYLTRQVVREMANELGQKKLEQMEQKALNEMFHHQLIQQIRMDSSLMTDFIKTIEQYLQQWIAKIIPTMDEKHLSNSQLETFLGISDKPIHNTVTNVAVPVTVTDSHLSVMSNVVYQSIREALSHHHFQHDDVLPWPTAQIHKGTVKGTVQIKPYGSDENPDKTIIPKSWEQAEALSELDVDVFDALSSFFLSNATHHQDIVEINLQDLLTIRGLKSKRSGNKRRGGYEPKQVQQVLKALSTIQDIWAELDKVVIYKKGKPVEMTLSGRPFIFFDNNQHRCDIRERGNQDTILFTVGDIFSKFLRGSGRQIALLPLKALQYNPRQEQWEKRLIRYLSWRWRTQARKADYQQPYKIGRLLQAIGKTTNPRTPSRTRERLEQALDRLQDDGLIRSWQYLEWDEAFATANGWARLWETTKVVIDPPEAVKEQYHSIARNGGGRQTLRQKADQNFPLGAQLKEFRKSMGLTLVQTAEELELSAAYVSTIERGKRIPSANVSQRIRNWVQT